MKFSVFRIFFSKPILKDCDDVIKKSKDSVFIDGTTQSITDLQTKPQDEEGITSVQLTTKGKLFEGDLSVVFHGILEGTKGNISEGEVHWPRTQ